MSQSILTVKYYGNKSVTCTACKKVFPTGIKLDIALKSCLLIQQRLQKPFATRKITVIF